jgi:SWI/SNF-related matrix-associated actin-dependent regulator 1 of chromatin subfamily A
MFATHNDILDELESRFPKGTVSLRGGMSDDKRQEVVDSFQQDSKVRLFLGSLKAAGVGITLTKSSTPCFMELGWNPATHDQAEDRCHRIGQKNAVNAYYLVAKNTIEERIARLIEKKRNIVDASSFGDPLSKSASVGNILGELITDLTGRESIDPLGDQARKLGLETDDEDDTPKKKSSKKEKKSHSSKKHSSRR